MEKRNVEYRTETNIPIEIKLESLKKYEDPFNQLDLDVLFEDPLGKEYRIPAFWAGGNTWKVRYSSHIPGTHHFRTECSDESNEKFNKNTINCV